jgi:hypothetical protein
MRYIGIFFLLALLIASAGCSTCTCKKVPCPAFNDPDWLLWAPYSVNQKLAFQNGGLTDTITMRKPYVSDAYDADKGCYGGDIGCELTYNIISEEMTSLGEKFSINYTSTIPFESNTAHVSAMINVENFRINIVDPTSQNFTVKPEQYSGTFLDSYTVGTNTYQQVQMITKDTVESHNKVTGPFRIFIAKGYGLVGYINYPDNTLWSRVQ